MGSFERFLLTGTTYPISNNREHTILLVGFTILKLSEKSASFLKARRTWKNYCVTQKIPARFEKLLRDFEKFGAVLVGLGKPWRDSKQSHRK